MQLIFTLTVLSILSLTAQTVYHTAITNGGDSIIRSIGDKKKAISIVSSRESGDMQLRFTADKKGEAVITIINGSGKIVLQQTSQVKNSINTIPLKNITGLAEGAYTIRLFSDNETYTTGFIVWK